MSIILMKLFFPQLVSSAAAMPPPVDIVKVAIEWPGANAQLIEMDQVCCVSPNQLEMNQSRLFLVHVGHFFNSILLSA